MREKATPIRTPEGNVIDTCGTGGDESMTFNISTASAFVAAGAGAIVAKHGNRSVSSRSGSADVLKALGVNIEAKVSKVEECLDKIGIGFLFAPMLHGAMKHAAPVRREIGIRTIFNILGPLTNPAGAKRQVLGVYDPALTDTLAKVLANLGSEHAFVVRGEDGLDEITITGKTFITELKNNKISSYTITSKDFGIKKTSFSEIKGGSPEFNIQIAQNILNGECNSRHLDLVLANSAMALVMAKKTKTLREGFLLAKQAVVGGLALRQFITCSSKNILAEIVLNKMKEIKKLPKITTSLPPSIRDFKRALNQGKTSIIAEIKQKSPSEGSIKKVNASITAKYYEQNGASAISVLCDKKFFGGSFAKMKQTSLSTKFIPILCKDFIISEKQISLARKNGANAILLISSILTKDQIISFYKLAKSLKMDTLCEVHTQQDLHKALQTPVKIIGINNRDLNTFTINLETTTQLSKIIPSNKIIVSESGIHTIKDLQLLPKKVNAALIGTSIIQGYPLKSFT
ncbi:MAG: anthranilate phosphoribosyltransferase, partial [Patescibacteria group bacterium]|nr:anthranilate phosphoribosyltransferase [Patescibacteria group bacterium]